jgi:deoxyribodipyrimidine photolyase-related protein
MYLTLDQTQGKTLDDLVLEIKQLHGISKFEYQLPDEYRLDLQLKQIGEACQLETECVETEHFLSDRFELQELFRGKKMLLMETFYRHMRKKTGILMHHSEPAGGKWNFDHDNRNKLDAFVDIPQQPDYRNDAREVCERIRRHGVQTFGKIKEEALLWPINRDQALEMLQFFISQRLANFGTYQDALSRRDDFMFHSTLSFALNVKLLHPLEVISAVEKAWYESPETYAINQVEGFIRQILGWREYMRGIYWMQMPAYAGMNFFGHDTPLPAWFWTGKTRMNCLNHAIEQSLEHAYAHHIQRLMITGNFALLAGLSPDELENWYLGIYIDAIEWVEITNTRGMSQFADGGIVGTKPYVSSAAYINKMGDYCHSCHYDHKKKTGNKSCPFNSFYWHFHVRNRPLLEKNPRIGMMYRTWDKMNPADKEALLKQADEYLSQLEKL